MAQYLQQRVLQALITSLSKIGSQNGFHLGRHYSSVDFWRAALLLSVPRHTPSQLESLAGAVALKQHFSLRSQTTKVSAMTKTIKSWSSDSQANIILGVKSIWHHIEHLL